MKDQVALLLKKEMDRKEFMKYMAAAGLMAVGGGLLLQSVGGLDKLGIAKSNKKVGYGSSPYGGSPKK